MHSKHCLANALKSAIENLRDDPEESDFDFRIAMQDNYALTLADEYLTWANHDGTLQICICS